MKFGKVAILITLAAAALRCSGNPPVSEPGQAPLTAPSAVVIHGIDHSATPSGTEVVLHGNYPFSYTSYQPDPKTLVLELLDGHLQGVTNDLAIGLDGNELVVDFPSLGETGNAPQPPLVAQEVTAGEEAPGEGARGQSVGS